MTSIFFSPTTSKTDDRSTVRNYSTRWIIFTTAISLPCHLTSPIIPSSLLPTLISISIYSLDINPLTMVIGLHHFRESFTHNKRQDRGFTYRYLDRIFYASRPCLIIGFWICMLCKYFLNILSNCFSVAKLVLRPTTKAFLNRVSTLNLYFSILPPFNYLMFDTRNAFVGSTVSAQYRSTSTLNSPHIAPGLV